MVWFIATNLYVDNSTNNKLHRLPFATMKGDELDKTATKTINDYFCLVKQNMHTQKHTIRGRKKCFFIIFFIECLFQDQYLAPMRKKYKLPNSYSHCNNDRHRARTEQGKSTRREHATMCSDDALWTQLTKCTPLPPLPPPPPPPFPLIRQAGVKPNPSTPSPTPLLRTQHKSLGLISAQRQRLNEANSQE